MKSPERRKLSIHVISKGKDDEKVNEKENDIKNILNKNVIIKDIFNFRRHQTFGSSPVSYKPIEEYLIK